MTFAVVEYSSKSGAVWHHTDTKPNYLCDPHTEIDPTSFGCYVSALKGEHIPLTQVIRTNKLTNRIIRNLSGSWPNNYPLHIFKKYDVIMVVYEVANGPALTQFMKRIKQTFPNLKILGVPTQPYGLLKARWEKSPTVQKEIQQFMLQCDIFLTIVKNTQKAWQELSPTPVLYLPQPYPVEYSTSFFKPLAKKQNIIYVPGVTGRPEISKGLEVAKKVQKKYPQYKIHVTNIEGINSDFSTLENSEYKSIKFLPWQEHLQYLSTVKLVINTDYTATRGRVQMDCAAIGTPSVGADSDAQLDLFPSLASTTKSAIDQLVTVSCSLLSNPNTYLEVTKFASGKLSFYNYPNSATRLNELVQTIKR